MSYLYLMLSLTAFVTLLPCALYLINRIRDPFHPLMFVGALACMMSVYGVVTGAHRVDSVITHEAINVFLLVTMLSVLGFYAGWGLHWRATRVQEIQVAMPMVEYEPSKLLLWAVIFDLLGVGAHFYTRHEYTVTGYVRDFNALWISSAILSIQILLMSPRHRVGACLTLAVALLPPLDRFFDYGQRGDTFRLAIIILPVFLYKKFRPSRAYFIPAVMFFALILGTLERTRGMTEAGMAANRVDAIFKMLPTVLQDQKEGTFRTDESWLFGTGMIQTVREEQSYEYGGWIRNIGVRFLPKELFDKDQYYTSWSITQYTIHTEENMIFPIPYGSAPTGFAHVFVQFSWAAPLFWMLLGYAARRCYIRALLTDDIRYHAYLVGYFIIGLYLISQDLYAATMNGIYFLPCLMIAYKASRHPEASLELQPAGALPLT